MQRLTLPEASLRPVAVEGCSSCTFSPEIVVREMLLRGCSACEERWRLTLWRWTSCTAKSLT